MKIKDSKKKELGEYKYNAQVSCDVYGNTISYFSYQKPDKQKYGLIWDSEAGEYKYYPGESNISGSGIPPISIDTRLQDASKFTDKNASKLAEALSSIDYSNYELIRGKNYEIKRLQLKYGYYIDILLRSFNDDITSGLAYNRSTCPVSGATPNMFVYIFESTGYYLASMQLQPWFEPQIINDGPWLDYITGEVRSKELAGVTITYDKSKVYIIEHSTWPDSYVPQITISGKSKGIENATDSSSIIDGVFTFNIKDGAKTKSFTFNLQMECYLNGIVTAWVK
jgi:hypothetical protein